MIAIEDVENEARREFNEVRRQLTTPESESMSPGLTGNFARVRISVVKATASRLHLSISRRSILDGR